MEEFTKYIQTGLIEKHSEISKIVGSDNIDPLVTVFSQQFEYAFISLKILDILTYFHNVASVHQQVDKTLLVYLIKIKKAISELRQVSDNMELVNNEEPVLNNAELDETTQLENDIKRNNIFEIIKKQEFKISMVSLIKALDDITYNKQTFLSFDLRNNSFSELCKLSYAYNKLVNMNNYYNMVSKINVPNFVEKHIVEYKLDSIKAECNHFEVANKYKSKVNADGYMYIEYTLNSETTYDVNFDILYLFNSELKALYKIKRDKDLYSEESDITESLYKSYIEKFNIFRQLYRLKINYDDIKEKLKTALCITGENNTDFGEVMNKFIENFKNKQEEDIKQGHIHKTVQISMLVLSGFAALGAAAGLYIYFNQTRNQSNLSTQFMKNKDNAEIKSLIDHAKWTATQNQIGNIETGKGISNFASSLYNGGHKLFDVKNIITAVSIFTDVDNPYYESMILPKITNLVIPAFNFLLPYALNYLFPSLFAVFGTGMLATFFLPFIIGIFISYAINRYGKESRTLQLFKQTIGRIVKGFFRWFRVNQEKDYFETSANIDTVINYKSISNKITDSAEKAVYMMNYSYIEEENLTEYMAKEYCIELFRYYTLIQNDPLMDEKALGILKKLNIDKKEKIQKYIENINLVRTNKKFQIDSNDIYDESSIDYNFENDDQLNQLKKRMEENEQNKTDINTEYQKGLATIQSEYESQVKTADATIKEKLSVYTAKELVFRARIVGILGKKDVKHESTPELELELGDKITKLSVLNKNKYDDQKKQFEDAEKIYIEEISKKQELERKKGEENAVKIETLNLERDKRLAELVSESKAIVKQVSERIEELKVVEKEKYVINYLFKHSNFFKKLFRSVYFSTVHNYASSYTKQSIRQLDNEIQELAKHNTYILYISFFKRYETFLTYGLNGEEARKVQSYFTLVEIVGSFINITNSIFQYLQNSEKDKYNFFILGYNKLLGTPEINDTEPLDVYNDFKWDELKQKTELTKDNISGHYIESIESVVNGYTELYMKNINDNLNPKYINIKVFKNAALRSIKKYYYLINIDTTLYNIPFSGMGYISLNELIKGVFTNELDFFKREIVDYVNKIKSMNFPLLKSSLKNLINDIYSFFNDKNFNNYLNRTPLFVLYLLIVVKLNRNETKLLQVLQEFEQEYSRTDDQQELMYTYNSLIVPLQSDIKDFLYRELSILGSYQVDGKPTEEQVGREQLMNVILQIDRDFKSRRKYFAQYFAVPEQFFKNLSYNAYLFGKPSNVMNYNDMYFYSLKSERNDFTLGQSMLYYKSTGNYVASGEKLYFEICNNELYESNTGNKSPDTVGSKIQKRYLFENVMEKHRDCILGSGNSLKAQYLFPSLERNIVMFTQNLNRKFWYYYDRKLNKTVLSIQGTIEECQDSLANMTDACPKYIITTSDIDNFINNMISIFDKILPRQTEEETAEKVKERTNFSKLYTMLDNLKAMKSNDRTYKHYVEDYMAKNDNVRQILNKETYLDTPINILFNPYTEKVRRETLNFKDETGIDISNQEKYKLYLSESKGTHINTTQFLTQYEFNHGVFDASAAIKSKAGLPIPSDILAAQRLLYLYTKSSDAKVKDDVKVQLLNITEQYLEFNKLKDNSMSRTEDMEVYESCRMILRGIGDQSDRILDATLYTNPTEFTCAICGNKSNDIYYYIQKETKYIHIFCGNENIRGVQKTIPNNKSYNSGISPMSGDAAQILYESLIKGVQNSLPFDFTDVNYVNKNDLLNTELFISKYMELCGDSNTDFMISGHSMGAGYTEALYYILWFNCIKALGDAEITTEITRVLSGVQAGGKITEIIDDADAQRLLKVRKYLCKQGNNDGLTMDNILGLLKFYKYEGKEPKTKTEGCKILKTYYQDLKLEDDSVPEPIAPVANIPLPAYAEDAKKKHKSKVAAEESGQASTSATRSKRQKKRIERAEAKAANLPDDDPLELPKTVTTPEYSLFKTLLENKLLAPLNVNEEDKSKRGKIISRIMTAVELLLLLSKTSYTAFATPKVGTVMVPIMIQYLRNIINPLNRNEKKTSMINIACSIDPIQRVPWRYYHIGPTCYIHKNIYDQVRATYLTVLEEAKNKLEKPDKQNFKAYEFVTEYDLLANQGENENMISDYKDIESYDNIRYNTKNMFEYFYTPNQTIATDYMYSSDVVKHQLYQGKTLVGWASGMYDLSNFYMERYQTRELEYRQRAGDYSDKYTYFKNLELSTGGHTHSSYNYIYMITALKHIKSYLNDLPELLYQTSQFLNNNVQQGGTKYFVKTKSGETITVEADSSMSIEDVKKYIMDKDGVPPDEIRIEHMEINAAQNNMNAFGDNLVAEEVKDKFNTFNNEEYLEKTIEDFTAILSSIDNCVSTQYPNMDPINKENQKRIETLFYINQKGIDYINGDLKVKDC